MPGLLAPYPPSLSTAHLCVGEGLHQAQGVAHPSTVAVRQACRARQARPAVSFRRCAQVSGALYSWVAPTPTGTEPTTLAASADVARLVGLDPEETRRPEFALIFSGAWCQTARRSGATPSC